MNERRPLLQERNLATSSLLLVLALPSVACASVQQHCTVLASIRADDGRVRTPCTVAGYRAGSHTAVVVRSRTGDSVGLSFDFVGTIPESITVEVACDGYDILRRGPFTLAPGMLMCPDQPVGEFVVRGRMDARRGTLSVRNAVDRLRPR
jgi:hypothetical protein